MLRPTDLFVCLYLSTRTQDPPGFERLAEHLGIGTAHRAVARLTASGLLLPSRMVQRRALSDVLVHAVRHVYYVKPGGLTRGMRTAEAAARRGAELYALLALVDALRIGQAWVRNLAALQISELSSRVKWPCLAFTSARM